jgi:hypothetical protein
MQSDQRYTQDFKGTNTIRKFMTLVINVPYCVS